MNNETLLALLTRCLDVVTYAVHEHGGGYDADGTPKGDEGAPGGWNGITKLMEDLEDVIRRGF